jgi:hypothetical protein
MPDNTFAIKPSSPAEQAHQNISEGENASSIWAHTSVRPYESASQNDVLDIFGEGIA